MSRSQQTESAGNDRIAFVTVIVSVIVILAVLRAASNPRPSKNGASRNETMLALQATGDLAAHNDRYARQLLTFADRHDIHLAAWVYHHYWRPPMLSRLDARRDTPNAFGRVVRQHLHRHDARRRAEFTALAVQGNRIINRRGQKVLLRGVNIEDPYDLKQIDQAFDERLFARLARDWKVNLIRVPIHPGRYRAHERYLEEFVDPIVEWGQKHQFYVLLDWHGIGNPRSGRGEREATTADKSLALRALKQMATRYREKFWVLYGTFNEPTYLDSWHDWRPTATELVDAVRSEHPAALVTVSGINWGYDLRGVVAKPVARHGVIYECHPYPWKVRPWPPFIAEVAQKYPVLFGEWGFDVDGVEP